MIEDATILLHFVKNTSQVKGQIIIRSFVSNIVNKYHWFSLDSLRLTVDKKIRDLGNAPHCVILDAQKRSSCYPQFTRLFPFDWHLTDKYSHFSPKRSKYAASWRQQKTFAAVWATHCDLVTDARWQHVLRSAMAQVIACRLMLPSHHMNQECLIKYRILWHSPINLFEGYQYFC